VSDRVTRDLDLNDSEPGKCHLPIDLSGEQAAIVADRGKRLQVIACAGSGKTRSIAARVSDQLHAWGWNHRR